jgi:hypothetical protein
VLVNGVQQGGYGLGNLTSHLGDSYDFGLVHAGDKLTFILHNNTLRLNAYSDPSLNGPYDFGPATGTVNGHNHIYSTLYDGTNPGSDTAALNTAGIPHGTYVAFEDQQFPGSNYNYDDEAFVFRNVAPTAVPEPSSGLIMLLTTGFGGAGLMLKRWNSAGRTAETC